MYHSVEEIDSEPAVENCEKKGSRADFVGLFQVRIFRKTFRKMFRERYLFRELQLTGTGLELKKEYMRRIWKFEKAFKTGIFESVV